MNLISSLFRRESEREEVDYYREGLDLLAAAKYHEALTSFRLALREAPTDEAVLQQIAIAHTRIGMTDEAAKTYRAVLDREPRTVGAHYGLAFLLLRDARAEEAIEHLRAFLRAPPEEAEARRHIEHAQATLDRLLAAQEA